MDTKTVILGTAGHIDHGKTTLVKALTGTDTDRLKEEKERGITIELGFARLELPSGVSVGVVDVPGHERFVKNMVAGVAGVDLVALVIAADEGVMPQTKEHLEICQLLGVKHGLVVLTKADMVDQEWLELVREDVKDFLSGTFLEESPVVAVSAVTGQGLDELLKQIDRIVSTIPGRKVQGPFRLPVDRSFVMKGFGTVVTGTVISGTASVGDEMTIFPPGHECRIRTIQIHGMESQKTVPGLRTALNLQGVSKESVQRGMVVALPSSLQPSYLLDIEFYYLESAQRPLKHRAPVRLHVGTAEVIGRILLREDEIQPGSTSYCQIKLEEPVAVLPGDRYVIRSYSPIRTIGGGRILNPVPRKRKRHKDWMWKELEILARAEPSEVIEVHLKNAGYRGLSRAEIGIRTGLYGKTLKKLLDSLLGSGKILKFEGEDRYVSLEIFEDLMEKTISILERYHEKNPLVEAMPKEELKSRLFPISGHGKAAAPRGENPSRAPIQKLFNKILEVLTKKGKVSSDKDSVRLSTHKVRLKGEEEKVKKRIEDIFKRAALLPPSVDEALDKAVKDEDDVEQARQFFQLLVREGKLIKVKEGIFYHPEALSEIERRVIDYLKKNQEMSVSDFRNLSGGLSRKFMIPLLEYLDSKKITIRIGDKRCLRAKV